MNTFISGSYFIRVQAAMLKLGLGLVLGGYAMASHAAQADTVAPGIDLISIPLAYSFTGNYPAAGLDANDRMPDRFGFGEMPRLPEYFNLKKVASWVASVRWHMAEENNRASFSPHLGVESRETLILIGPVNRSITMVWHRALE